jgi:large subunit ribosomal protein L17
MKHQNGRKKLNLHPDHKRAMMRNQVMIFITNGTLISTKVRIKEVRRLAEKLVTIAREGNNFNAIRRVNAMLPYKADVVKKLFADIAPKYVQRPGGYTRIFPLGKRLSDGADRALLTWVE